MANSKNDRTGYRRREVTAPVYGRSLPVAPDLDSPFFTATAESGRLDWRTPRIPPKHD